MTATECPTDAEGLFDYQAPPPVSLADKFIVPPFSVLDARAGVWQDRKRRWLTLGIESELGRSDGLTFSPSEGSDFQAAWEAKMGAGMMGGTSVFDPVLCELAYRWFTPPGARVLDPFAGGSVRGVTASVLARWYYGVELRAEQVEANRTQAHLGTNIAPTWIEGDATRLGETFPGSEEFDFIFTCPPYADLEVYSDDDRDLSNQPWPTFLDNYRTAIRDSLSYLRRDRFAAWVISDVRDKKGNYRGLVAETVRAFQDAGAHLHNDAVLLEMVGSAAIRAPRTFEATRRVIRTHQHLLVFVKGDAKKAATYAKGLDQ